MPDLGFHVIGVDPRGGRPDLLPFRLRIAEAVAPGAAPTPVHSARLRCQVRIEPGRRRYSAAEQGRLIDLFGTPDRWSQTVRDLPWADVVLDLPGFVGETETVLPVPRRDAMTPAAGVYLDALEAGEAPVIVLFSGTVFYEAAGVGVQVAPVPWDREARFRLPVTAYRDTTAEPVTP